MRHSWNQYHPGELTPRDVASLLGREYIDAGLVGQILGALAIYGARDAQPAVFVLACVLFALGNLVMLIGCYRHATYLGYRGWVAALGLLSILGIAVLYCLPDRIERGRGPRGFDVVAPRKVSTLWVGTEQDAAPTSGSQPHRSPPPRVPWKL